MAYEIVSIDRTTIPDGLLDIAKMHMRVDFTSDDAYIKLCVMRATDLVERHSGASIFATDILWTPFGAASLSAARSGIQATSVIAADASFADGAFQLALPDYYLLVFDSIAGQAATIEAGGLRIVNGGKVTIEFRVSVTQNWGSWVIFGYGWNGSAPLEFGRVQINSNDPVPFVQRYDLDLIAGGLLALYMSSDFPYQQFTWTGGEIIIIQEAPTPSPTPSNGAGGPAIYQFPFQPVAEFKATSGGIDVSADYHVASRSLVDPVLLVHNDGTPMPADLEIDFTSGYASSDDIPPQYLDPILRIAGHLYEHRESVDTTGLASIPQWANDLLMGNWIPRA